MSLSFSTNLTQRVLSWADWKALYSNWGGHQWVLESGLYTIWFYDGPEVYITRIWESVSGDPNYSQEQNDSDRADFEANFKDNGNATIQRKTADGRLSVRMTAAEGTGKLYRLRTVYFETASAELRNSKLDGTSYGDAVLTCHNEAGEVVSGPDFSTAVRTSIDFEQTSNFELLGGWLDIDPTVTGGGTDNWWVSVTGAPHIPAAYGGSIDFVQPVNLELVASKRVQMDGRASTVIKHDANYHSGKIRITIEHPAGVSKCFQICLETFR